LLPPCRNGLACRPTQPDGIGVCAPAPVIGEPCGPSGECGTGACDVAVKMCAAPGSGGTNAVCTSGLDCASFVCVFAGLGDDGLCAAPTLSVACAGNQSTPAIYRPTFDAGVPVPPDARPSRDAPSDEPILDAGFDGGAPADAAGVESGTIEGP
jgi:hypothetical protein